MDRAYKHNLSILTVCVLLLLGLSINTVAQPIEVDVCHYPPDNPENYSTITISEEEVMQHLGHGDYEGACEDCPCDFTVAGLAEIGLLGEENERCNVGGNGIVIRGPQRSGVRAMLRSRRGGEMGRCERRDQDGLFERRAILTPAGVHTCLSLLLAHPACS